MKTENRLNHIRHIVLCLVTVGLWVPVYLIRLCANEMANRIVRAYNEGYMAAPSAVTEGRQVDVIWPKSFTDELRDLQSRLSRCEFDKSLYHLRLCQLVTALNSTPLANTSVTLREAHQIALNLVHPSTDQEYTRVIKNADMQLADLRRLVNALASMTDGDNQLVAHPGPELTELQAAYKQAVNGVYWGRP